MPAAASGDRNSRTRASDQQNPSEQRDDDGQRAARPEIMREHHRQAREQAQHAHHEQQRTVTDERVRGLDHRLLVHELRQRKQQREEPDQPGEKDGARRHGSLLLLRDSQDSTPRPYGSRG
jgi:hypothetical protein